MSWIEALPLDTLEAKGKAVVRHAGRQILVLKGHDGIIHALPNRCPHEGYPLSEGVLTDGCVLTCNWHNWKFDLESGETLVGGDKLLRYPVRVEAGMVLLDVTPPDPAERRDRILATLDTALADADQQRLVREAARLDVIGADPLDAVRVALDWTAERLRFGTTHAIAGAPDWLALYDQSPPGSAERLVAIGEILGHLAEDARDGQGHYPYAVGEAPWDKGAFLAAIEREDEAAALALVRGALREGRTAADLAPVLIEAALAHYADFGHLLIYTIKTIDLIRRLGPVSSEILLAPLVRSLVYATREDLLPEFRDYAVAVAAWGAVVPNVPPLAGTALRRSSPQSAMATVGAWSTTHSPEAIFATLVGEAAWMLLHVDEHKLIAINAKLADNIGWLDFTHALTFADAGSHAARLRPDLWPAVLLQLACFIGRNAGYVDHAYDGGRHAVADSDSFLSGARAMLFDHGRDRFIVSVHLLKTLMAGAALIDALPGQAPVIAAALNRLLGAPMKFRHTLRTALQMREMVAQE
jgi:nitrite reductase/ring-hydroxylating ferredoxin subunit